nr:hypothetical protein [Bacillus thuringiensis]
MEEVVECLWVVKDEVEGVQAEDMVYLIFVGYIGLVVDGFEVEELEV